MTPDYLAAVLALLTTHPAALVLMTLRVLLALHVAVPYAYLVYRIAGGQWDGIDWGWRVLRAVHELRRARVSDKGNEKGEMDGLRTNTITVR